MAKLAMMLAYIKNSKKVTVEGLDISPSGIGCNWTVVGVGGSGTASAGMGAGIGTGGTREESTPGAVGTGSTALKPRAMSSSERPFTFRTLTISACDVPIAI